MTSTFEFRFRPLPSEIQNESYAIRRPENRRPGEYIIQQQPRHMALYVPLMLLADSFFMRKSDEWAITIFISSLDGASLSPYGVALNPGLTATVLALKAAIEKATEIPVHHQNLTLVHLEGLHSSNLAFRPPRLEPTSSIILGFFHGSISTQIADHIGLVLLAFQQTTPEQKVKRDSAILEIQLYVTPSTTLSGLKEIARLATGVKTSNFELSFRGRILEGRTSTLEHQDISDGSIVRMISSTFQYEEDTAARILFPLNTRIQDQPVGDFNIDL